MDNTDDTDFLPCPFCGNPPLVIYKGNDHTAKKSVTVKCPKCRVERTDAALRGRENHWLWLRETALKNWNARFQSN